MSREPDATAHHDDLEDFNDIDVHDFLTDEEDPIYTVGYNMGFDTGFIEGYQEGQLALALEKESSIYNLALEDIITQVDKFTFNQKDDLLLVLKLLRRI
jgi:hypothetical protein